MEKQGVSLKRLNTVLIAAACLVLVFAAIAALRGIWAYREVLADTERYIESVQDASRLQAGSDYLTEQVRAFVITGDPERVANYFEEVNVTRRRDDALENLDSYFAGTETYRLLREALDTSNELMLREYRAMCLTIDGLGYALSDYPETLRALEPLPEDAALSPEAKLALARSLVFDEEYQAYKDRISSSITRCTEALSHGLREEQLQSAGRLQIRLWTLLALLGLLTLLVVTMSVCDTRLVIRPLYDNIACIHRQERLPVSGSSELRYLARVYNTMFDQQRQHQEQLSYEASHDSLTGLYNRSAFDKLRESLAGQDAALILVDLDHFKTINDSYGHDVGDRALKKTADVLLRSFRGEDYVCRIGGDEFAVLMVRAGSALRQLVADKVRRANEWLGQPEDGLPPLSLSVGVAFPDRENPGEDIFKDADTALYRIKENGRNGCAFY